MTTLRRSTFALSLLLALCRPAPAQSAAGGLVQLPGTDGCISNDGSGGECAVGRGLGTALDIEVSPDGRAVYVASFSDDAIATFVRNRSKAAGPLGALRQPDGPAGCASASGHGGQCAVATAVNEAFGVAVSRDGKSVYVAGSADDAVVVFARDPETSLLQQLDAENACVSEDGSGGMCRDGRGLGRPLDVAVAPDGKHAYAVSGESRSIATMARNRPASPPAGALAPIDAPEGCVSDVPGQCDPAVALSGAVGVVVSPDGRHVYAAAQGSSSVTAFARDKRTGVLRQLSGTDACISRDGSGGACATGRGLVGARGIAISRDGRNVYVASEFGHSVAIFARDKKTGVLRQLAGEAGCLSEAGTPGACADAKAILSPRGIAVSRNGKYVYVAASQSNAVAVFARDRKTGALAQLPGVAGCVSEDGTGGECSDGRGLDGAFSVAVTPDGKNVYVASLLGDSVAVFEQQRR